MTTNQDQSENIAIIEAYKVLLHRVPMLVNEDSTLYRQWITDATALKAMEEVRPLKAVQSWELEEECKIRGIL